VIVETDQIRFVVVGSAVRGRMGFTQRRSHTEEFPETEMSF